MANRFFAADLLKGQRALVTGASSGIGAVTAQALSAVGASVVFSGRNRQRLDELAGKLADATVLAADLAISGEAEKLIDQLDAVGPVDILINSAGFGLTKRSARLSEADIDGMFAVNVRAALILSARLGEAMKGRGRGSIVNISSVVGALGTPFQAGYAATKGAIEAMTRSLARELTPVRVNAVAPGLIATEMWGDRLSDKDFLAETGERVTLRRWGTPEAIADAVVFLASEASNYVTGQVLTVDGGLVRTGDLIPPKFFTRPA